MKNIHILPTEESGLWFYKGVKDFLLTGLTVNRSTYIDPRHIYITSDEEIKEGDWCLDKFNQRWKLEDKKLIAFDIKGIKRFSTDNILGHECKKIILTTDQDLIKDGVQPIDDKFLEWFVKNPSCESVEVINDGPGFPADIYWINYLPEHFEKSIPQEEPKQDWYCPKCQSYVSSESVTFEETHQTCNTSVIIEEPKQETLEEAAENYGWRIKTNTFSDPVKANELAESAKQDFIAGAKWQAERMYSEEDLREVFKQSRQCKIFEKDMPPVYNEFEDWFQQFKKK